MRHTRTVLVAVGVLGFLTGICSTHTSHSLASPTSDDSLVRVTANLPFSMHRIELPQIPARTVNVTDFGAVGDGVALNTAAFAKAVESCANSGGGRVVVPQGIWLTGPIQLKSNIDLNVERGAVIQFSSRVNDYPLVRTTWEGSPAVRRMSPIYGTQLLNISITGEGIFDGAGDAWRMVKKSKLTEAEWKKLVASGGIVDKAGDTWWPSADAMNGALLVRSLDKRGSSVPIEQYAAAREYLRPVLVSLIECKRVLLDGPTFQNSPAWNIHPLMCEDLVIRNLTVLNPWYSQNGDGLDLDSCRRAAVYNCRFDVGDDAICLKSGRDEYGRKRGRPCEEIVISDCVVYHGHGGFTVGSEMSGGVRNVVVRRCTFLGTDLGLRFKTTRGRGGVVEKIWISDIVMKDIPTDAIGFNMYYSGGSPIPEPNGPGEARSRASAAIDEGTPRVQDVFLKNIICRGAERAVQIEGLPEMPIRGIELDNVQISSRTGVVCVDAERIKLTNLQISPVSGPVIFVRNSREVTIDKSRSGNAGVFLRVEGEKSQNIRIKAIDLSNNARAVELHNGAKESAVVRQ
jgi:polygalacturonase